MDTPTWSLILDSAKELGAGGAEFSRAELLRAVLHRDPAACPSRSAPLSRA
jgi:hypothetical protein